MRATVVLCLVLTLFVPALSKVAFADDLEQAHSEFEKGLGSFALGNYAEAATHYEKAFAIKPDPALLYNAAQAHRLAGNKQRALLLYASYLRTFGGRIKNTQEVQRHIADLKSAIESEDKARTGPPLSTAPASVDARSGTRPAELRFEPVTPEPTVVPPAPVPDSATTPALVVVVPAQRPVYKKPWFWAVVGGAVVVVLGVGLGVGLSAKSSDPTPALGVATVR